MPDRPEPRFERRDRRRWRDEARGGRQGFRRTVTGEGPMQGASLPNRMDHAARFDHRAIGQRADRPCFERRQRRPGRVPLPVEDGIDLGAETLPSPLPAAKDWRNVSAARRRQ